MASMATPDSGDSNLPNESGNEVCDIINCLAIYYEKLCDREFLPSERKVPSTGFKESEDSQSFKRNCQVCLLFQPCLHLTFYTL